MYGVCVCPCLNGDEVALKHRLGFVSLPAVHPYAVFFTYLCSVEMWVNDGPLSSSYEHPAKNRDIRHGLMSSSMGHVSIPWAQPTSQGRLTVLRECGCPAMFHRLRRVLDTLRVFRGWADIQIHVLLWLGSLLYHLAQNIHGIHAPVSPNDSQLSGKLSSPGN